MQALPLRDRAGLGLGVIVEELGTGRVPLRRAWFTVTGAA